jgi:hypothetical protein
MASIGTRGVRRWQRKDVARNATIRHSSDPTGPQDHGPLTKRRTDDVITDRTRSRAPQGGQKADQNTNMHKSRSAARTTDFATQIPAGQANDCDRRQQSRTARTTEFSKNTSRTSKTTAIERQQSRDKQAPRRGLPNTLCTSRTVTTTEPRARTRETAQHFTNHRGVQGQLAPMDRGRSNGGRGRSNFGIKARTKPNCPCPD